jgi:hypothetical protein
MCREKDADSSEEDEESEEENATAPTTSAAGSKEKPKGNAKSTSSKSGSSSKKGKRKGTAKEIAPGKAKSVDLAPPKTNLPRDTLKINSTPITTAPMDIQADPSNIPAAPPTAPRNTQLNLPSIPVDSPAPEDIQADPPSEQVDPSATPKDVQNDLPSFPEDTQGPLEMIIDTTPIISRPTHTPPISPPVNDQNKKTRTESPPSSFSESEEDDTTRAKEKESAGPYRGKASARGKAKSTRVVTAEENTCRKNPSRSAKKHGSEIPWPNE